MEATQRLVNVAIPDFSQKLDAKVVAMGNSHNLKISQCNLYFFVVLQLVLHRAGINVRYMLQVFSRCKNQAARAIILTGM